MVFVLYEENVTQCLKKKIFFHVYYVMYIEIRIQLYKFDNHFI